MNAKECYNKKLLVEGKDDEHVIYALRQIHNIPVDFDVVDCEGITKLFDQIHLRILIPENEIIGIIIDADDNLSGGWQSISAILTPAGFKMPDNIPYSGLILRNPVSNIKVGIWIMPDNNVNGMLEDFMRFLIPPNDNLLPIADNALNEIEKNNYSKYSPAHRSKALIHTWLAWQEESGKPLGQSITMRYLHTDNEKCAKLIEWIRATFSDH